MSVDTITQNHIDLINNFESVQLETTGEGIVISVDYHSDNWSTIYTHSQKDTILSALESMLKKLQSSKCLGHHPFRYSQSSRPGVRCDIVHMIISLTLIDNEEMKTEEFSELLKRLRQSSENAIKIPHEEINALQEKLRQSQRKKASHLSGGYKLSWRL